MNFNKNNLDKSLSPYLQQHKNNPIHWQEWNPKALDHAKKNDKLILVSIGYAACHWCHVMAKEAFSNHEIADFLNENYVSIKVDREQRPDIDQYMMSFLIDFQGHGGWPLNVILTPNGNPIYGTTYVPVEPRYGIGGFLSLLKHVKESYGKNKGNMSDYRPPRPKKEELEEKSLIKYIMSYADRRFGGFVGAPKFPPHNTILFLLNYYEKSKDQDIKEIIETTLNVMSSRGLHDHLQGGFYRYSVDSSWTIPHFEKMLYDQAMMLWVYSSAYKVFKQKEYKKVVGKIIKCLEETFEEDGLFYSAHDADTNHEEGATYLWGKPELEEVLTKNEFDAFSKVYQIIGSGNFEGKNHLIKNELVFLDSIEEKLLKIRKKRDQPFTDKKIVTSWNALAGIGLLMAYRFTGNEKAKEKAINLFNQLLIKHYKGGLLCHSSLGGKTQNHEFLEDYASLLLLATYIFEETGKHKRLIEELYKKVQSFYMDGEWYQSFNKDFKDIPAQKFDHPIPSSISLAEMSMVRSKIIFNKEYDGEKYSLPLQSDFLNLASLIKNGLFHIIHSPEKVSWSDLPLNSIQLKGDKIQDCYLGVCRPFESMEDLINSF